MDYWLNAQLPPQLAPWLTQTFSVPAFSVGYLGYRDASYHLALIPTYPQKASDRCLEQNGTYRACSLPSPPDGIPCYSRWSVSSSTQHNLVSDDVIFEAARQAGAVVVSKDSDFLDRIKRFGPPPQLLWITCGNTSTAALKLVLLRVFPEAHRLFSEGEAVVEVKG